MEREPGGGGAVEIPQELKDMKPEEMGLEELLSKKAELDTYKLAGLGEEQLAILDELNEKLEDQIAARDLTRAEEITPAELHAMALEAEAANEADATNPEGNPLQDSPELQADVNAIKDAMDANKDLENSPEGRKVAEEIKNMPAEKKKDLWTGIKAIGFKTEQWKNNVFKTVFGAAANFTSDREKTSTRWMRSLENVFKNKNEKVEEKVQKLRDGKGGVGTAVASGGYLAGNVLKYGRIATDIFDKTALISPLRYVMMGASMLGTGFQAGKEARFMNPELIEAQGLRMDREAALAEAVKIMGRAEAKAAAEGKPVSRQMLTDAYHKDLPAEILKRLGSVDTEDAKGFIQKSLGERVRVDMEKLSEKIEEIDGDQDLSDEDKEMQKDALYRKYEVRIKDYDRAVSKVGTVDGIAMAARYAELGSKAVVLGMQAETVALLIQENLWGKALDMFSNASDSISDGNTDAAKLVGAAAGAITEGSTDAPEKVEGLPGGNLEDMEGQETIKKGGSVSKAVHAMVKKGEITEAELKAAWTNPESIATINGEKVHVSKLGLVYEGNEVKFIPGENGEAPRIQVTEGRGEAFGTDTDLHARYEELNKQAPDWLEKSVHGSDWENADHTDQTTQSVVESSGHSKTAEVMRNLSETSGAVPTSDPEQALANAMMDLMSTYTEEEYELAESGHATLITEYKQIDLMHEHFNKLTLASQEAIVDGLEQTKRDLENMDQYYNNLDDGEREIVREARDMIEDMERELEKHEQLLKDKLASLGVKKPADYEILMNKQKISVKDFAANYATNPDPRTEKFAAWVASLKPNKAELGMNLGTFIRTRFR